MCEMIKLDNEVWLFEHDLHEKQFLFFIYFVPIFVCS